MATACKAQGASCRTVLSRLRFSPETWSDSNNLKVSIDTDTLGLKIEMSNIEHNGMVCVHYEGDKKNVYEECRVDFAQQGKVIMAGKFNSTSSGLNLSFDEPDISGFSVKVCQSSECKSNKNGVDITTQLDNT